MMSKRALGENTLNTHAGFLLAVGVLMGILGTLVLQGFGWAMYRTYKRKQALKRVSPRRRMHTSRPLHFRHIEHCSMPAQSSVSSPTTSTASLLRVANRLPDGSWTFSEPISPPLSDDSPTQARPTTAVSAATSRTIEPMSGRPVTACSAATSRTPESTLRRPTTACSATTSRTTETMSSISTSRSQTLPLHRPPLPPSQPQTSSSSRRYETSEYPLTPPPSALREPTSSKGPWGRSTGRYEEDRMSMRTEPPPYPEAESYI